MRISNYLGVTMLWSTAMASGVVMVPAAFAQASQSAPEKADDSGLQEIVVTAQRRAENAQDVPIAVAAVTGETATALGISGPETLGLALPGVTFNRQGNGVVPYVRGVGTPSAAIGNEPSVALFIDDVYVPTGQAAVFDFNNIESVSVAKGPQGTLFGRNATGGVIQIRTLDPTYDTKLKVEATYANYNKPSGSLYFSSKLSDNVAFNIAAHAEDQKDGWGRNVLNGDEVNKTKSWGVRGKLLFEPSDNTKILLAGNYDWRSSDQGGFSLNVLSGTFGTGGFSPDALGAGFYDAVTDYRPHYKVRAYNFSGRVEHDFGNAVLKSVTAYGKVASPATSDLETSPSPFVNSAFTQSSRAFSQEFQLASASGGPVNWILGTFYFRENALYDIASTGTAFGGLINTVHGQQKTNSISGFGQMSAELLPRLNGTIGVRYTNDKRAYDSTATLGPRVAGPFADSTRFKNVTGRIALDYHINDDVMVYAAFNKGFKSGIYNIGGLTVTATAAPPPVLPEELNAYTAGFKTEFWDRKLRFNAEAYYYDYTNIQVSSLVAGQQIFNNGGKATIKGFDAELTAAPVKGLTLSASVSVADGKYDKYPNGIQFFPLPPNQRIPIPAGCAATVPTYPVQAGTITSRSCDLSGNKTVQTVPLAVTATAIYEIPTTFGDFTLTGSWSHNGNYFFDADNSAWSRQPKYDVFNASIAWKADSGFGLRFWASNITREKYYNAITQSTLGGVKYAASPPRTYGVTASYEM